MNLLFLHNFFMEPLVLPSETSSFARFGRETEEESWDVIRDYLLYHSNYWTPDQFKSQLINPPPSQQSLPSKEEVKQSLLSWKDMKLQSKVVANEQHKQIWVIPYLKTLNELHYVPDDQPNDATNQEFGVIIQVDDEFRPTMVSYGYPDEFTTLASLDKHEVIKDLVQQIAHRIPPEPGSFLDPMNVFWQERVGTTFTNREKQCKDALEEMFPGDQPKGGIHLDSFLYVGYKPIIGKYSTYGPDSQITFDIAGELGGKTTPVVMHPRMGLHGEDENPWVHLNLIQTTRGGGSVPQKRTSLTGTYIPTTQ